MIYKTNSGYGVNFNQLAGIATPKTINGITCTHLSDGGYRFTGTANSNGAIFTWNTIDNVIPIPTHKYYIKFLVTDYEEDSLLPRFTANGIGALNSPYEGIITASENANQTCYSYWNANTRSDCTVYVIQRDLTVMFGTGNEPTTVAEFREMYPDDYYDYTLSQWQWARKGKITAYPTPVIENGTTLLPIENHIVGLAKNGIGRIEIEGNSYQNGTPTPTSPIPIQSFNGSGDTVKLVGASGKELQLPNSITLNNQTISLELNKVGTYADKLIIDKASGKVELVRNVKEILVDKNTSKANYSYGGFYNTLTFLDGSYAYQVGLCDYAIIHRNFNNQQLGIMIGAGNSIIYYCTFITAVGATNASEFNTWLGNRVIKTIYGSNYPTITDITNATYQINGITYNVSDWLNFVDREIEIETDGLAQSNLSVDYEPTLIYNYAKRELPVGFVRLDYIESTGTQWIDTGVKGTTTTVNTLKIVADAQFTEFVSTSTGYIIGVYNNQNRVGIFERATSQNWEFSCGDVVLSSVSKDLNRHIFINDTLSNKWSVDDASGNLSSNSYIGDGRNLTLFAYNNGPQPVGNFGKLKLYSCKLYDNDTLVRNFIPCYRYSDGIEGLYDTVNKQFYTNQGTGRFLRGNIIDGGILNNGN